MVGPASATFRLARDALVVLRFDFGEAVRSRLFVGTLALYALVAIGASALFLGAVQSVKESLLANLGPSAANMDLSASLAENPNFIALIAEVVGSEALARELVRIPALALFNTWLGFFCVPLLVILTASDSITSEVASGSCRFALIRTPRLAWALGKLFTQTVLMTLGIGVGSVAALATGVSRSEDLAFLETALWMLRLDVRVACYGFAFVGLTMGISALVDRGHWARALAFVTYIGLGIGGSIVTSRWVSSNYAALSKILVHFFPGQQADLLWQPSPWTRLSAVATLFGLGAGYFVLGYLRFGKRDV